MRARNVASFVLAIAPLVVVACVHEERRVVVGPGVPELSVPSPPPTAAQYLAADPTGSKGAISLSLGQGQQGIVVDRRRVVVGRGEPRIAADNAPDPIMGASRIPGRFGGGFLFWTAYTLYRSDAFESHLKPIARVPDHIEAVSFGPKAMLARTRNGERWGLGLPNGDRSPIAPLGVADVQALDDGRAIGFNDQGAVFTSIDGGGHWVDATTQIKSAPTKVAIVTGDLWLIDTNGGASRLEPDGHLSWFDKAPPETDAEVRPKDPRWRGAETPLRAALHFGAAIDDHTAIVVDSGDLVRVDVRTGDVISVVVGRLPPDALCEAVPVSGDVLFACNSRTGGGSSFVVSHTLSQEPPIVEQAFAGGGNFFTSDDGGIVYSGSCMGIAATQTPTPIACVRGPGGRWEERDVSGLSVDGGAGDVVITRWVPRSDGRVVALVVEPSPGIYDPQNQSFQPLAEEAREAIGHGGVLIGVPSKLGKVRYRKGNGALGFVDPSWSFAGNALRGWQRHGEAVELGEDGRLRKSPYTLDMVYAGALGLGRSKDGRLYQSNDHGASWVEVAAPPSGVEATDLGSCTSAGCDLGAFYRVGWTAQPPRVEAAKMPAPAAPEVRRIRGLELSCRPQGGVVMKSVARSGDSPEDLGFGAARLPVANEKNDWSFVRFPILRSIASPIHDAPTPDENSSQALRALLSGFGTNRDGDVITVAGPNKNAMALRRAFAYTPAFDPAGRIVRTSIAMSDVVAAGRRVGMTTDEILAEDFTDSGNVIAIASSDPREPSDVALHNADHGLLAVVRGERVRVAIRTSQNNANVVSAVALPGDETAFLEVDSNGIGKVFKLGANGITDLFDVSPTANEAYYPANPDALAVGPKGELAILRTPSGSDPASALDPAFLVIPATPPSALAPWSEVKLADEPVCKAEKTGFRATLQTVAPWVRVSTPELRVEDAPMLARVRWSAKRLCLEGFEVKLPSVSVRTGARGSVAGAGSDPVSFSTWLVAKGSTFARVGVTDGIEWRQALECSVVTTGP
jgi:hypothetical protein